MIKKKKPGRGCEGKVGETGSALINFIIIVPKLMPSKASKSTYKSSNIIIKSINKNRINMIKF